MIVFLAILAAVLATVVAFTDTRVLPFLLGALLALAAFWVVASMYEAAPIK